VVIAGALVLARNQAKRYLAIAQPEQDWKKSV